MSNLAWTLILFYMFFLGLGSGMIIGTLSAYARIKLFGMQRCTTRDIWTLFTHRWTIRSIL